MVRGVHPMIGPAARKVLLVEDSPVTAKLVESMLHQEGFQVTHAPDSEAARRYMESNFDVILLDLRLPDGDGLDLCRSIRLHDLRVPVLMMTATTDEESLVQALALGASDYFRKPFGKRELLARIQRCLGEKILSGKTLRFGDLELRTGTQEVLIGGKLIPIRRQEFIVLSILVQKGGEIATREEVLRLIDVDGELLDRTLDSYVSRIRCAFRSTGVLHLEISTVRGAGYRIRVSGNTSLEVTKEEINKLN